MQTSATPGNAAIQPAEQKLTWLESLRRVVPLLIVMIVVAAFARTLDFGLYLDDHHHARPWTLPEVLGTFAGPFDPLGIEPPYFRPLVVVTFALDWSIWGFSAWGYHLTNVLLHTIASLLVYFFLRRIKLSWLVALTGALFFAIIPANAATAIYISERSDAMVAIFSLCGLLSLANYHRDGHMRWLVALNAMVALAIGSKEIGVSLPFLAIFFWMYLVVISTLNLENNTVKRTEIRKYWLVGASQIWQTLTTDGRLRQLARVVVAPLTLLMLYMAYRMLVLPTGLVSSRYSTTASPLRGFASAVFWTFKAVPWEVASLTLPVLAVAIGLAILVRPWSTGWRIVLLGVVWVAITCLPLAYLGQVEPRLLYLPEVGHSILLAGLVVILSDFVRSALEHRHPKQLMGATAVFLVALALFGTTAISFFKAQDEFQPLGYKMLRSDYEIYTDLRYRHLYPEVYIKEIEQTLQQAGMLP